jgi:hypothetical protein
MFRTLWFHKLLGLRSRSVRRRQAAQNRRCVRLHLEGLEERVTPATLPFATAANASELQQNITFINGHTSQAWSFNLQANTTFNLTAQQELTAGARAKIVGLGGDVITPASGIRAFKVDAGATAEFDNLSISGAQISATAAKPQGGAAIWVAGGGVTLSGASVTNNTVFTDGIVNPLGGGIFVTGAARLTIANNSHIDGNQVVGATAGNVTQEPNVTPEGGGLFVAGGVINISNSTLSNNKAVGGNNVAGAGGFANGGGMFVAGAASVQLSNLTVDGNVAQGGSGTAGGGVAQGGAFDFIGGGPFSLVGSTMSNNQAIGGSGGAGAGGSALGGGMNIAGATSVQLSNLTVDSNVAQGGSGAASGNATGGAFAFGPSGPVSLVGSVVTNNKAIGGNASAVNGGNALGGALFNTSVNTTVLNSSFLSNTAQGGNGVNGGTAFGGAIDQGGGGSLNLLNSTLGLNKAQGGNGFAGAQGSGFGGGLSAGVLPPGVGAVPQLFNNTIVFNQALNGTGTTVGGGGGGIWSPAGGPGNINAVNNIVQGNTTNRVGPDINAGGAAVTSLAGNIVGNTGPTGASPIPLQIAPFSTIVNGLPIFPLLPNAAAAIKTGNTSTVAAIATAEGVNPANATDQVGNPRTTGGGLQIDFGAVQFIQGLTSVTFTNVPPSLTVPFGAASTPSFATTIKDLNGNTINNPSDSIVATVVERDQNGNLVPVPGAGQATVNVNASGTTTIPSLTLPPNLAAGSYFVQLQYTNSVTGLSGTGDEPLTVTVAPATVTANPVAPLVFNTADQSLNVSATVTSPNGTVNEGAVTFTLLDKNGMPVGSPVSANVSGGSASTTLTVPGGTVIGNYTVQASYLDAAGNFVAASPSSTPVSIATAPATVTANPVASITASTAQQSVAVSATVTSPDGTVNEGNVTFTLFDKNNVQVAQVVIGVSNGATLPASLTLPPGTPAGTYTIQAVYSDPANNFAAASPSTTTLTIQSAATTTTAGSLNPITISSANQSVPVSATVTSPSGIVTEGTVTFTLFNSSNQQVGLSVTANVSGGVTSPISLVVPANTPSGSYTVKASYTDSKGVFGDSSNTTSLTIKDAAATTTSVGSLAPIVFSTGDQSVNVSASVSSASGPVSGTVTFALFNSGGVQVGVSASSPVSGGSASASLVVPGGTPAGSYTVKATFADSAGKFAGSAGTQLLTVNSPPAPVSPAVLPAPPPPPTMGQAVFSLVISSFEIVLSLNGFGPLLSLPPVNELVGNIGAVLPFAGGFGPLAVIFGANAANDLVSSANQSQ